MCIILFIYVLRLIWIISYKCVCENTFICFCFWTFSICWLLGVSCFDRLTGLWNRPMKRAPVFLKCGKRRNKQNLVSLEWLILGFAQLSDKTQKHQISSKVKSFGFTDNHSLQLSFSLSICWGSPFLLAMIVLVVMVGFPLFGTPGKTGTIV